MRARSAAKARETERFCRGQKCASVPVRDHHKCGPLPRGFLLVAYDIPRGCLAAYYPETNALVPLSSFAERARTPTSKSIPVLVRPHRPEAGATRPSQRDIPAVVVG